MSTNAQGVPNFWNQVAAYLQPTLDKAQDYFQKISTPQLSSGEIVHWVDHMNYQETLGKIAIMVSCILNSSFFQNLALCSEILLSVERGIRGGVILANRTFQTDPQFREHAIKEVTSACFGVIRAIFIMTLGTSSWAAFSAWVLFDWNHLFLGANNYIETFKNRCFRSGEIFIDSLTDLKPDPNTNSSLIAPIKKFLKLQRNDGPVEQWIRRIEKAAENAYNAWGIDKQQTRDKA